MPKPRLSDQKHPGRRGARSAPRTTPSHQLLLQQRRSEERSEEPALQLPTSSLNPPSPQRAPPTPPRLHRAPRGAGHGALPGTAGSLLPALGLLSFSRATPGVLPFPRPCPPRPFPSLPFHPRGEHGAAPRSPEASIHGPGARLGPTGPAQGPHGEPPGRADTGTAPPGLPAPFPPHHRGAPGPGPAGGRAEIEAWRPRYRGLSPEQGPGPTGAANSAPGPDRGSTGERGEPTGGQGSPFPRFPEVPKPPRPRRAPPGRHSPQRRGRPARRPRPPPLTDFKRGSAVRTSQSAPAARPRRALIGRSASRLQEDPDVPARRAGGDGKCRAQTHRAVCGEPEANYNSHNAQGDGA